MRRDDAQIFRVERLIHLVRFLRTLVVRSREYASNIVQSPAGRAMIDRQPFTFTTSRRKLTLNTP